MSQVNDYYEPFDRALPLVYEGGFPRTILSLYRIGAEAGDALSQYALGSLYLHGNKEMGIKVNTKMAIAYFRKAARTQCRAMFDMGVAYAAGNGVKKNQRTAFAWFSKAAANGSIHAKLEVARRKIFGEGTSRNIKQGRKLERSASAQLAAFNACLNKPEPGA